MERRLGLQMSSLGMSLYQKSLLLLRREKEENKQDSLMGGTEFLRSEASNC